MRMFKTRKIFAALIAAVLVLSMSVIPAFAFSYTAVAGTYTTFDKYLIIDENANVPDVTFDFSIAAGEAKTYTAGSKFAVYAGNDANRVTGTPTIAAVGSGAGAADADFNPGDTVYTTVQGTDQVTLDSGEKYAKKTVGVDFSTVTFKEPGVYRYVISETNVNDQGMTYDTQAGTAGQKTRILDVYVTDDGQGALVVSNYVLHETPDDVDTSEDYGSDGDETKSKGFVNEYATFDLTFAKNVAGNQASRDQYFKFTVAITNAGANTLLDVDLTNASASVPAQQTASPATNAAYLGLSNSAGLTNGKIVCSAEGAATVDFYLQHGESIQIKGLPKGATYTITEVPEDYRPSAVATGDSDVDVSGNSVVADSTTGITADTVDTFTNTKGGVVPTGVTVAIGSGLLLAGLGFAGFALTKKRKKDED